MRISDWSSDVCSSDLSIQYTKPISDTVLPGAASIDTIFAEPAGSSSGNITSPASTSPVAWRQLTANEPCRERKSVVSGTSVSVSVDIGGRCLITKTTKQNQSIYH